MVLLSCILPEPLVESFNLFVRAYVGAYRAYICMIVIIVLVSLLFLLLVDVTLIVQPVICFNTVDATQCTRFLFSLLRHIEWHSSVDVFTLSSPLLFCQSYDIPSVKVQSMCY